MVFLLHPKFSWGDQALEPRESEETVDPETAFGQNLKRGCYAII